MARLAYSFAPPTRAHLARSPLPTEDRERQSERASDSTRLVLGLQHALGNGVVSQLLARARLEDSPRTEGDRASPGVARALPSAAVEHPALIARALLQRCGGQVHAGCACADEARKNQGPDAMEKGAGGGSCPADGTGALDSSQIFVDNTGPADQDQASPDQALADASQPAMTQGDPGSADQSDDDSGGTVQTKRLIQRSVNPIGFSKADAAAVKAAAPVASATVGGCGSLKPAFRKLLQLAIENHNYVFVKSLDVCGGTLPLSPVILLGPNAFVPSTCDDLASTIAHEASHTIGATECQARKIECSCFANCHVPADCT